MILSAGCGGGGGDGSGDDPAPPAPPPPPPPFGLTAINVAESSQVTLDLVERAFDWARYTVEATEHAADDRLERFWVVCDAGSPSPATFSVLHDNDSSSDLTAGDAIRVVFEDCGDTTSELRFAIESIDVPDSVSISFSGDVTVSVTAAADPGGATVSEYRATFRLDYTRSADDTSLSLTEVEASAVSGVVMVRLQSGNLQETINGLDHSVEFSGRVESDSLGGSFDVETPTAFAGSLGGFPSAGELRLSTDNSSARITPATSPDLDEHAAYQVDANGSGEFSDAVTARWRDWVSGSLFGWYPLLRGLTILPRNPVTSDPLRANFRLHHSTPGFFELDVEWSINGAVQAGVFLESLPSSRTSKGDIVQVRVTVTAGDDSVTRENRVTIRNQAPHVDAFLSPERPDTRDAIAVSYRAGDIDGDPVETTVRWSVNGTIVPDLDAATLPANRHGKNDVVRALVTASDGESETTHEVEVTIRDAIPVVSVAGAPESVSHGALARFDAEVSDPDGDDLGSLRFAIDYGPPGMTVDPVTGQVEWDARVPMFDRELDVGWQVGLAAGPSEAASGVLRVTDPDRAYPFMVSGHNGPHWVRPRLADIDADGQDEMLLLNGQGHVVVLEWDGEDLRQSWAHPFAINDGSGVDTMTNGDIDGDGLHELFLLGRERDADTLVRLDGADRQVSLVADVPQMDPMSETLEFADLDNDGSFELIYIGHSDRRSRTRIVVLSADDLSVLWESEPDYLGFNARVGNVDDDEALEIVVSGGYAIDGATRRREWSHESAYNADSALSSGPETRLLLADLDGDGVDEMLGKFDHDDFDAGLEIHSVAEGKVFGDAAAVLDPLFNYRTGVLLAADIDDDGATELLGYSASDSLVLAYRFVQGTEELREILSQEPGSVNDGPVYGGPVYGGPWAVGDLDGDGETEIVLAGLAVGRDSSDPGTGWYVVAGFNPEFELESTGTNIRRLDGGFAGGRPLGDASTDETRLLFALWGGSVVNSDGPRAVFLSPGSGEYSMGPPIAFNDGEVPVGNRRFLSGVSVSDYDGDGVHELLASVRYGEPAHVASDPFAGRVEWSSNDLHGPVQSAVDLNGDGFDDVLARWTAHDVVNDTMLWESQPPYPNSLVEHVSAGDLDGDGIAEIVAVEHPFVAVYSRTRDDAEYTRSLLPDVPSPSGDHFIDVLVADTDADGRAEILLLNTFGWKVERFGGDLERLNSFPLDRARIFDGPDRLFVLPGSGQKLQLLVTHYSDYFTRKSRLVAHDPATGRELWESPRLFGRVLPNSVHYFVEGGEPRLAIGTSDAMYVTR